MVVLLAFTHIWIASQKNSGAAKLAEHNILLSYASDKNAKPSDGKTSVLKSILNERVAEASQEVMVLVLQQATSGELRV